jgi:hypothetical protein
MITPESKVVVSRNIILVSEIPSVYLIHGGHYNRGESHFLFYFRIGSTVGQHRQ